MGDAMPEERWLPIVGYEGYYEVSDCGNVRSVDRTIIRSDGKVKRWKGRPIRVSTANDTGRPMVRLSKGNIQQTLTVAVEMARAFLGPRPAGMYVCHGDDVPFHNVLSNLRYATPEENARDKTLNGYHDSMQKETCDRGHPLVAPNLLPSGLRRGARNCLACSRGYGYAIRHGLDIQATTDAYHREILRKAAVVSGLGGGVAVCVRDHPLVQPNLVASEARKGRARCLACKRAFSELIDHPERDLDQAADEHYRRIMATSEAA